VLSFLLEQGPEGLEGEVIASAETAARESPRYKWPAEDELLLYLIHGTLHLVGYNDATPKERAVMRAREREVLRRFGVKSGRKR
jgi:probable rRNA maturation factor